LLEASPGAGLEVIIGKTKYTFMSRHQSAGHDYNIKKANKSFRSVTVCIYLGTAITNQLLVSQN